MIKQSFAWWSFSPDFLAPQDILKTAADIGYAGVEMPPVELWPLIKRSWFRNREYSSASSDS